MVSAAPEPDATTRQPALNLPLDKVTFIILKAREYDVKESDSDPDEGSNAIDDGQTDVLTDKDDDPGKFRTLITFDEQTDGKTVLTLRQMHPTRAQRDAVIGFGAVEYGGQTLDKLAAHLAARKS